MRYVAKGKSPEFFENAKIKYQLDENKKWDDLPRSIKRKLKIVLWEEQFSLCIYCEGEIPHPSDKNSCYERIDERRKLILQDEKKIGGEDRTCSHIEHIKPKGKFPLLKFSYENLMLSCEGIDDEDVKLRNSCGHHKDDERYKDDGFDEAKFINPVQDKGSASYFSFYPDTGKIYSSGINDFKANYTIDRLNLNARYLILKRLGAKQALLNFAVNYPNFDIDSELSTEREFISFLRYCFLPETAKSA